MPEAWAVPWLISNKGRRKYRVMEYHPGIRSGLIARDSDLRALVYSLADKPFAVSPPVEVEDSFMMGLASEDLPEGLRVHLPLSALSEVVTLLFATEDGKMSIYVHSLKQLINWFYYRNIKLPTGRFQDVSIAAYVLKPPESDKGEDWQEFLLSTLVRDHLGREYPFLPRQVEHGQLPEVLYERLSEDASSIWQLGEKLIPELQSDPLLYRLYTDVEMPLVSLLAEIEREGVEVDLPKIRRAWPRFEAACMILCDQLTEAYGQPLNPFSTSQIKEFLYSACGTRLKHSDSVDDDLLKGLSPRHPLIRKLLAWRKLHRVIRFFKSVSGGDRCYPTWWQTRTSTGRIVCTDPALQSLPKSFRRYFVPGDGRYFIKADFSAFQLRLLAHLSGDETLVEMFRAGGDPHDETRQRLAKRGIHITRSQAKAVNFAICYGGTAWSIQTALGCDLSTAHKIVKELSAIYPGVKKYLDSVAEALTEAPVPNRHVRSLYGRRRCFYNEGPLTEREKRQARNAVVQMLEADVFKISLLELHRAFRVANLTVKIVLLLHDGIWFTCPAERATVARVKEEIQKIMENSVRLSVPLKVEFS
jgi:DNA polymerase-1